MAKKKSKKDGAEDEMPAAKIDRKNLAKALQLFDFIKPLRGKFLLGLVFLFLTGATAIVFPRLLGKLIDSGSISMEMINKTGIWLLVLFALQSLFSYFRVVLFVQVTESLLYELRNAAYSRLIKMPLSFFASRRVGELNSRISADLSQIGDTFTINLAEFLRQLIIIIGGIIALFFTSIKLAGVMLAIIPVVAVLAVIFGRYIRKLSRQVQDAIADSNTIVEETLQGITNVKAFTNEFFEIFRYGKKTSEIKALAIKGGKARGAFFSFIIFCLFGAIILLIWFAVRLETQGELTHGTMIEFMIYTIFVGASIGGIAEQYSQIQKALGATERVLEILKEEPEPVFENDKLNKHKLLGAVSFEQVNFAYPARLEMQVLKQLSFDANPGETIAIVGQSGAGKSTIISLLLRFYPHSEGKILVDGKEINEYPLSYLRDQMAIVPQDVLLFGGTIRENIAYAAPEASMEEIKDAAIKANAHEFIHSFPQGYDTLVGERGVKLSGGQRQRIAIARAVLKNPSILLLDEATSSLDSESERLVQEALDALMVGRTTFVVAHRLSTIRKAHKILVIDDGRVAETGTHDELILKQHGIYAGLSKLQFDQGNHKSDFQNLNS
jgi:ABC-type multidrug transport system fused ATPase/permease subunit